MKLVRVGNGCYRSEDGAIHVIHVPRKELPWSVRFKDGIGCQVERRFNRLADCREYLAKRSHHTTGKRAFEPGETYRITYVCRDIGYGIERGEIIGRWNGIIDTWGKLTIETADKTLFLFRDEIKSFRRAR